MSFFNTLRILSHSYLAKSLLKPYIAAYKKPEACESTFWNVQLYGYFRILSKV
jgi:hypothetical protein